MKAFVLSLALLVAAYADPGQSVIEHLIQDQWRPYNVEVTWSSTGALPISLAAHDDWDISTPLPPYPCGNLIVQLESSERGESNRIAVSGTAKVVVSTFTVSHTVAAGSSLTKDDLQPAQIEWRPAFGQPLMIDSLNESIVAAHALIPNRPVTQSDLKSQPTIQRGQKVSLFYQSGSVRVMLPGRALGEGKVGDQIQAATESPRRVYNGRIMAGGNVEITL